MNEPIWLTHARKFIGVHETPGAGDNETIVSFFASAGLMGEPFTDDETPWCAAFVGAVLATAGFQPTRSALARSYERWIAGIKLGATVLGAITVLDRSPPHPTQGHVGFLIGRDAGRVALLGGNQNDAVTIAIFARTRVRGYYWPKEFMIEPAWVGPQLSAGGKVQQDQRVS